MTGLVAEGENPWDPGQAGVMGCEGGGLSRRSRYLGRWWLRLDVLNLRS